jgi:hypothetical protein
VTGASKKIAVLAFFKDMYIRCVHIQCCTFIYIVMQFDFFLLAHVMLLSVTTKQFLNLIRRKTIEKLRKKNKKGTLDYSQDLDS